MKTIIAGSRDVESYDLVEIACSDAPFPITEVVSGCARGVDKLGERWAEDRGIPIRKFPANWNLHGKSAGPIRNREMAEYGEALIAIWDGESKGTKNMIENAYKHGLRVHLHLTEK